MIQALFVTTDRTNLAGLAQGLQIPDGHLEWASSGKQALAVIGTKAVDLVVVDEKLSDMTGLAFIEKLVKVNPMVNCAAVSSLPASEYHEASEGLGILMQLSMRPTQEEGKALIAYLKTVQGYTKATSN